MDKGTFGGGNPNLPTKKTSIKPIYQKKKAFLAFQHLLTLMVYCKFADKPNVCVSNEHFLAFRCGHHTQLVAPPPRLKAGFVTETETFKIVAVSC